MMMQMQDMNLKQQKNMLIKVNQKYKRVRNKPFNNVKSLIFLVILLWKDWDIRSYLKVSIIYVLQNTLLKNKQFLSPRKASSKEDFF